ncbi:polymer-forming cytoskeletal protein [Halomonas sp. HP20-15]|uniref:bactofilin family protein n=1 Tax=Halomonas sp. HP20-15 TaxID=3085901 RepID=UPI0029828059|nr:polymer-forming cytoskeletal protein [Halomonas sp. HP20-15]MDW5375350.1 polymer-forming cytoskeletal protein [Halomonas sp. HP20-15]
MFILSVVALIVIMLDGKRRIGKRAQAPQPTATDTAQDRAALLPGPIKLPSPTKSPINVPLPARPAAASPRELPIRAESRIGPSLRIKGKVESREALVIHGSIEGSVTAQAHGVTVTASGRVSQCIEARIISVAGSVTGRLVAADQALLLSSAQVFGSIDAKRLKCETGAWLKATVNIASR